MKNFKLLFLAGVIAFGMIACDGNAGEGDAEDTTEQTEDATGHDHDGDGHDDHAGHEHDNDGTVNTSMTAGHGEGMEYNYPYVCPMHCEGSGSKEAGKCPVCDMDYVLLKEHMADGHDHNE